MHKCSHFPHCGGCSLLETGYPQQLSLKKKILQDCFSSSNVTIKDIVASPSPWFYRHKVQLPFGFDKKQGGLVLGCYGVDSHSVVNQAGCVIQDKDLTAVVSVIREWAKRCHQSPYNEQSGSGFLRHVLLRKGAGTGEILIGIVTNGEQHRGSRHLSNLLLQMLEDRLDKKSRIVGIVQNINTRRTNVVLGEKEVIWWGRPYLKEVLGTLKFKVGLSTFFQVNPYQTPNLYDEVKKWIPQGASVLDLYSGTGSIALWVSPGATEVTGIEENRASVEAARFAAKLNQITNVKFMTGDTAQILPSMVMKGYSVAVVDPPRKGLDSNVVKMILNSSLEKLIYVSCNPQSLARDISVFKEGFRVVSLQGFDMFPHTEHVECVAVLSRKQSGCRCT